MVSMPNYVSLYVNILPNYHHPEMYPLDKINPALVVNSLKLRQFEPYQKEVQTTRPRRLLG